MVDLFVAHLKKKTCLGKLYQAIGGKFQNRQRSKQVNFHRFRTHSGCFFLNMVNLTWPMANLLNFWGFHREDKVQTFISGSIG